MSDVEEQDEGFEFGATFTAWEVEVEGITATINTAKTVGCVETNSGEIESIFGILNSDSDEEDFTFNDSDYSFGEEDDIMFQENVIQNIEVDMRNEIVSLEVADESYNSEYAPSDDLRSVHSDSDEEVVTYPKFNGEVDMVDPVLEVGLKFRSKKELKCVVKNFSIHNRFEVVFPYNDRCRLEGRCKEKRCPWRIWASPLEEDSSWQIKSFEWNHTCSRALKNISVSASWLAHRYIETFTIAPKWDVKLFKATVLKEYGVEISDTKAWRARRYTKELLRGSLVGQFGLLGSYASEVRRTNPGSTVILSLDEIVFKAIYVCFDACKKGFLGGCRPVICIDGCFLKGNFSGQLLAAVGIDGNDCIFPIAHAIVETESNATWSWFLKLLGEDLMLENAYGVTIMSDRQKGLENIVSELFPMVEHRFCVRHMYANFFRKDFKELKLRDLLWRAAKSTYVAEFRLWMDKIKEESEAAWEWLCAKPTEQRSKSHFMTASKCDILLNNLCECFNNYIREARGKDILTLLQSIQNKLMVRMYKRRDLMARSSSDICPKILKKLDISTRDSFSWKAIFNGKTQFQVSGPYSDGQFVVDLKMRTCSCRKWDLTGVPCPHAIAGIREWGKDPLQFVDESYKVATYLKAYGNCIYPINGQKMWPSSGFDPVKPPTWVTKKRGRKQTKRRRGVEEALLSKEKMKKIDRRGDGKKTKTCSICGRKGHNKIYHSNHASQASYTTNEDITNPRAWEATRKDVEPTTKGFAYSQPTNDASGIEQLGARHFLSQPNRRPRGNGSSTSTTTLNEAWNNLMRK